MNGAARREARLKRNQETRKANEKRLASSKGKWPMLSGAVDALTFPSSFGGGWIIPMTPAGSIALADFFDEEPAPIPVPVGEGAFPLGYIIEPYQVGDLADHMKGAGVTWERG